MDEALVKQQQSIYAMKDVDENEPAVDLRKRKADDEVCFAPRPPHNAPLTTHLQDNGKVKKQKKEKSPPAPKQNTAIYVTGIPDDADPDEVYDLFKKCGLIAESPDTNQPRIKLYTDDNGNFKGDALISTCIHKLRLLMELTHGTVFFRPESVALAIDMLDGTDFRLGLKLASGPMRVTEADRSFKAQKDQPLKSDQAKTKGTGANRDRKKVIQKNEDMNRCVPSPSPLTDSS